MQSAREANITQLPVELCRENSVESSLEVESQGIKELSPDPKPERKSHTTAATQSREERPLRKPY